MAVVTLASANAGGTIVPRLAEALGAAGHEVAVHLGPMAALAPTALWRRTQLLVPVLVGCGDADMAAAPALHAIVSPLIGVDRIDIAAATTRGILVANTASPMNAESMAEATVMLLLAALYDLRGSLARMRPGVVAPEAPNARMLQGKTVGVLGYGAIARGVIARLAGWGCRIVVHTRSPPASAEGIAFERLEAVLAASDVVLVLMDLNPSTHHLIDARRLRLMKDDAVLVNVSRGAIIDESALAAHLRAGRLAAVALDVFEQEPPPADSPLRALPNAILTPHCVGHTRESIADIPPAALEVITAVLAGQPPPSVRNPDVLPSWQARS